MRRRRRNPGNPCSCSSGNQFVVFCRRVQAESGGMRGTQAYGYLYLNNGTAFDDGFGNNENYRECYDLQDNLLVVAARYLEYSLAFIGKPTGQSIVLASSRVTLET